MQPLVPAALDAEPLISYTPVPAKDPGGFGVAALDEKDLVKMIRLYYTWNVSETTLRFMPDGEMIALTRPHWIGTSKPPYMIWSWTKLKENIGGPNFIRLPDGNLWAAARHYGEKKSIVLAHMTRDSYQPVLTLPSGGDCSYPGMVWCKDLLWLTYYSSHEGKTSISLAKINVSLTIT